MNIRQTAIPRRVLSLALCAAMVLTLLPLPTPAEGICDHHPEHTADCGYKAAVEGQDCAHSHDSLCGYQEASPCSHSHDESCGYREASACAHRHTEECGENGESCTHQHDEACGYQEASPCTHSHDESCGYREARDCTHPHDDTCGYVEAVTGSPCTYRCEICAQQASQQQNGQERCTHGNESAACETCASEKKVTEVQALINALPETVTEETREAAQSALSAVEEAKAALTEAEKEKLDLTRYTALKALLAEPEAVDTGKVLTDWEWVDDYELIDPETGLAHLPFASAENIAYYDAVIEVLPAAITANEEELTLGDWLCADYPMESGAYEGEYVFETTLPEGYVLADGTNVLRLTVVLGDPEGEQAGQLTISPEAPPTGTHTINSQSYSGVYELSTPAHLYWFAKYVNETDNTINAVLTENITVNSDVLNTDRSLNSAKTDSFEVWTPIGTSTKPYLGKFDGQDHTISGLYVNDETASCIGLFGNLDNSSFVTSVTVADSYFSGSHNIGGICGSNREYPISYCINYATVCGSGVSNGGTANVGGICGENGQLSHCENRGLVTGSGKRIGGISGIGAEVRDCINYGAVQEGSDYVGGIVGYSTKSISDSENRGAVNGQGEHVGGICGLSTGSVSVTNCENHGTVHGDGQYVGGICGDNYKGSVDRCTNSAEVTGSDYNTGGIAGGNTYSGKVTNCRNEGDVIGSGEVGGIVGHNDQNAQVSDCTNTGSVTGSSDWIGGIVGRLATGTVTGCENRGSIKGTSSVGGIVGQINDSGTIETCKNSGTVTGCNSNGETTSNNNDVGGICGDNMGGEVRNCENNGGAVKGYSNVGGICGRSYKNCTISDCKNSGEVTGGDTAVGGICGKCEFFNSNNPIAVTNCENSGKVTGRYQVGGVCGLLQHGTINGCVNTGEITSRDGNNGGICGATSNNSVSISKSYNTGSVKSDSGSDTGGICGSFRRNSTSSIAQCYNSASVSGNNNVGGICGNAEVSVDKITNCYYLDTNTLALGNKGNDSQGPSVKKTAEQFASGEVAYLLNGSSSSGIWKQNIDKEGASRDETPNFSGAAVYAATSGECPSDTSLSRGYTNDPNGAKKHIIEGHLCVFCGYQDQFPITVSGITAVDKAYDGSNSAELVVTFTGKQDSYPNVSVTAIGTFNDANAGANKTVTISNPLLEGNDAGKYYLENSGPTTTTGTINPKDITVTITPGGGTYGSVITIATANLNDVVSGQTVPVTLTYTGTVNDGTSYNSTTVPTEAGTYIVTASINNSNYNLTGNTKADFKIEKATVTTPTISSKKYTGQLLTADVPDNPLYTVKTNKGGTEVNVSGYPVELQLTDDKNYQWDNGDGRTSFRITKAANNWTVNPAITGWTYGEQANAPTSGAKFGTAQVTYLKDGTVLNTFPANAGSYTAHFSVAETDNYDGLTKDVPFTISPKPVTVSGITAGDKTYDGNTTATLNYAGVTFTGKLDRDSLTVEATGTFESANAAENKTVNISGLTLGGDSKNNYALAANGQQTTATATITSKPLSGDDITVTATNPTYNGAQQSPAVTVTYGEITLEEGKDYTLSGNAGTGAGTYTLKVELKGNYSGSKEQGWVISKATITPVVSLGDTVYGDTLNPSVSGNSGNGEVTYTYYSDAAYTVEVTPNNVGTYYVRAAVAETANYQSGTSEPVPFQITPRPVIVSGITAGDKTYDGNTTATLNYDGVTFTGKLDRDSLTVKGTGTFADANAAENKTVDISGLTLGGASEKNYVLATVGQQATATAAITKANASVTKAPEDAKSLYSGVDVALVTEGTAQGGTMMYRLGEDGSWTAVLPQAAAHGEYTVYYYVKGDDNHEDTAQQSLKARIRPFEIAAQPQTESVNYGESKTLAVILNHKDDVSGITYQWCLVTEEDGREVYTPLEGETGSSLTLTKPNAGTYVYGCVITCGEDYSVTSDKATVTVTAVQKPLPSTTDLPSGLWAEGGEMPLVDNSIHLKSPSSFLLTSYAYNGASTDVHQNYPTGMEVYSVGTNDQGQTTVAPVAELNHLLRYSGCSIRITGKPGIRMITSLTKEAKAALKKGELAGYTLEEYGTVAVWSSDLGNQPLTLKTEKARNNYAYKRGVSDPVFANVGNLTQYTNVLVWDSLEDQKYDEDIVMRPYIKLSNKAGETVVLYGGTVSRSIGYVAQQNANTFSKGTAGYKYVHEIIDKVNALHSSTETNTTGG